MNQPIRHRHGFAAISLISLIAFQGIGWRMAWQFMQWQVKVEAHSALFQANTEMLQVVLHQDVFRKSKVDKHEIRLEGNLYDIRSCALHGDSIKLVLYHDWHEQALFAIFGGHHSRLKDSADANSPPLSNWVAQWLGTAFLMPTVLKIDLAAISQAPVALPWHAPLAKGLRSPPFTPPRIVFEQA